MSNITKTETRTATLTATLEAGVPIVEVSIRPSVQQSLRDAEENLTAAASLTRGKRCPILVDLLVAEPLSSEVRHFYSGKKLRDSFTALGLLVNSSPFGRTMGNIYIRVARPGVPLKLFHLREVAIAWLKGRIA